MVDVSSQNNSASINVSSGGNSASIKATPDMAQYYSEKSREWAISNRIVDNTDYSSKYYAEKSKESEAKAENYERSVIEKYNSFVEISNQAETELQTLRDDSILQINTAKDSGIIEVEKEIEETKKLAVEQVTQEANKQLQNIESTGFYMRDDKLYFINSKGEEEEFKSGGAGAVMFDTKIADHILQGEEALGWALQGTYVTKKAYPDFYNKCLEEYSEAEFKLIDWVQPINPTGISSTSGFTNPQNAFDGNSETYANCGTQTDYIEWDLGQELILSGFNAESWNVDSVSRACNVAIYNVDNDGVEHLLAKGTGAPTIGRGISSATFTPVAVTKLRFKLIAAAEGKEPTTQYPSRVVQINLIGKAKPLVCTNLNGHKFYPIEQKTTIDEIYNQYGIADFYGIDEENERIFLPRNKYFHQLTDDVSKVNQMMEAGLPKPTSGLLVTYVGTGGSAQLSSGSTVKAVNPNPIYGKSNTVQPPSSLKLLYYCVGNTEVTSAITNVTEITESENDSNPLGSSFYFKNIQPNAGWLKSEGQWNSGNIYTTFYNWLVDEKTTNTLRTDIKDVSEEYTDFDYVLNQDEMTFRLPLLNGD
jgi:hypothetical protein